MKTLLLSVTLFAIAVKAWKSCEKIQASSCRHVGYNHTSMPNFAHQGSQAEAELSLKVLEPLIQAGCFPHMKLFACAVYVPMCAKGMEQVGPCMGLCEKARQACAPVVQKLGYKWPEELECSKFYHEDDYEHMCIMGPLH